MFYTQVNAQGMIVLSMYTEDPSALVPEGSRLLPDNPPQPPIIIPGITRAQRVEPVPQDATEVPYTIVDVVREPNLYEVLL